VVRASGRNWSGRAVRFTRPPAHLLNLSLPDENPAVGATLVLAGDQYDQLVVVVPGVHYPAKLKLLAVAKTIRRLRLDLALARAGRSSAARWQ